MPMFSSTRSIRSLSHIDPRPEIAAPNVATMAPEESTAVAFKRASGSDSVTYAARQAIA
jgi:hypothetical protein